ncbi:MAG: folate-binding protein [Candidatus Competibacter sp.]|nr:folate-binding protein [Candidatus Competibacter sp.]MDG4582488.1 folate-binding protein [Candidatus Competibacter sp.]
MNAEWSAFLQQAGAVPAAGRVSHFDRPESELRAALDGNLRCDLSHLGLIAAADSDNESFLQGQLTCDVRQVTLERSLIGAYCNPKGRALASFRLFRRDGALYLELPGELLESTLARLRRYLLRARATLTDASDAQVGIGVAGPNATARLTEILGKAPAVVNEVIQATVSESTSITLIRLPGPTPRFELHGAIREMRTMWEALGSAFVPVGAEPWRLLDILAGIPTIYPETAEAFVPQMLNLQLLEGISFQKGCYTGQEVVARTHHLGKLKRRMYLARVDSPSPPRPGDPLFSPQSDASQSAGRLVDAARHPDGGYAVLAVALIECAEHGMLQMGDASGPALQLQPLHYGREVVA